MKKPTLWTLLVAGLGLAAVAAAQTEAQLRVALQAEYNKLAQIYQKRDANGMQQWLRSVVSPQYSYIARDGSRFNQGQFFAKFQDEAQRTSQVSASSIRIDNLRIRNNMATVNVTVRWVGRIRNANGKVQSIDRVDARRESWIGNRGSWRLTRSIVVDDVIKIDGKQIIREAPKVSVGGG